MNQQVGNGSHQPAYDELAEDLKSILLSDKDDSVAVAWFINQRRTKRIYEYNVGTPNQLFDLIRGIQRSMVFPLAFLELEFIDTLSKDKGTFYAKINEVKKRNDIVGIIAMNIFARCKPRPTKKKYEAIVDGWSMELAETIVYLSDYLISKELSDYDSHTITSDSNPRLRQIFKEHLVSTKECRDPQFMESVIKLLGDIRTLAQPVIPFIFLCAPSGSGKSTFAYNLAMEDECATLYFVKNACGSNIQPIYEPFRDLSIDLNRAISTDLDSLLGKSGYVPEKVSISAMQDHKRTPFETVNFIVSMFEKVFEAKRRDPSISWLEAEFKVDSLTCRKVSINDGKMKLRKYRALMPLIVFIDEVSLTKGSGIDDNEATKVIFLQSILRLLEINAFFAGTDAKTCNICTSKSSRNGLSPVWRIVMNDLPRFQEPLLKRVCDKLLDRFGSGSEVILPIIEFLEASAEYEIPWLIDLAVEYFMGCEVESVTDTSKTLNLMIKYIADKFHDRKYAPEQFTESQLAYLTMYKWTNDALVVNRSNDICINRHLGYLHGVPFAPGCPYFYLRLRGVNEYYINPFTQYGMDLDEKFVIRSIFTSFIDAPLSGMFLYGLDRSHRPFVYQSNSQQLCRITSIDTILCHFWSATMMKTGDFLEYLYNAAVVVASRAGGINGSKYADFLGHFIRELSSVRRLASDQLDGQYPSTVPTVNVDYKAFGNIVIPLLAPMAVPSWPQPAVKLLVNASNGQCRLGTFQYSTGNECVDHVIFETNNDVNLEDNQQNRTKIYNNRGKPYSLDTDAIKRIALVSKCKSHVNLSYILQDIIDGNFEKPDEWKLLSDMTPTNCNLFHIFALKVTDSRKFDTADLLAEVNSKQYYLWRLAKNGQDYSLKRIPNQKRPRNGLKNVVIMSLEEIVGKDFVDSLIEELARV